VLLLLGLRPALRRRLDRSVPHSPSRAEAVVGGTATVGRAASTGTAAGSGSATTSGRPRSFDEAQVIEPGERVTVVRIAGRRPWCSPHHPLH
jgi:membrane protein implicated in regulation of membrane protease activity